MLHSIGLFNRQVEDTMSYAHISQVERCQIAALIESGKSIVDISRQLGRQKSSIYREPARKRGGRGHQPVQAQRLAEERRHEANAEPRKSLVFLEYVESCLRLEWNYFYAAP